MKVSASGTLVRTEYVSRSIPNSHIQEPRAVFLVQVEGEWDLWFSKTVRPSKEEIDICKGELELYYRRDWGGSGHVLPMLVLTSAEYAAINCN